MKEKKGKKGQQKERGERKRPGTCDGGGHRANEDTYPHVQIWQMHFSDGVIGRFSFAPTLLVFFLSSTTIFAV